MKKALTLLIVLFYLHTSIAKAVEFPGVINTADIVRLTTSATLSCMNWEVRGACVWMSCALFVCSFDVTLKVQNHVPELLVQTYNRDQGEPWTESQKIIELLNLDQDSSYLHWIINKAASLQDNGYKIKDSTDISGGTRTTARDKHKSSLSFYYVDVWGNPGLLAFDTIASSSFGYICGSNTTPFMLHYNSNLDIAGWRWNYPEVFYPRSWLVGSDLLGGATNNWGSIYPRQAFSIHQDPLKSAVLKSFRVMHFVTGNPSAHLVSTLDDSSEDGYWPYGPLDQNDANTGIWQMLYPKEDSDCHSFPYDGTSTHESRRSDDASYVWNFWKAYKCCEKGGNTLVFHWG